MHKSGNPRLNKEVMREIGWRLWDPIGLFDEGDPETMNHIADEYDPYLTRAAGMLRNGKNVDDVAQYLYSVEVDMMGVEKVGKGFEACLPAARALAERKDLWDE